jgi:3-methyladenine DNA glycosylase AlkD
LPRALAATDHTFLVTLRAELHAHADPIKAKPMQAYMKSTMPYLGIMSTPLAAICRAQITAGRLPTFACWRDSILALWREAAFREERYAALAIARHRLYDDHQTLASLPMYRELIVTGAWWDYVDVIASRQIGGLLRRYPTNMAKTLRAWSRHQDMWLRRSAIIAQLHFGHDLDWQLLYDCIEPSLDSREFFLRKAIGWALRQYARTHARDVLRYVNAHRTRLSGLSTREALKHVRVPLGHTAAIKQRSPMKTRG